MGAVIIALLQVILYISNTRTNFIRWVSDSTYTILLLVRQYQLLIHLLLCEFLTPFPVFHIWIFR